MAKEKPETQQARRHAEFEAGQMARYRLVERLVRWHGDSTEKWRTCPQPICRRQHACAAAQVPCWDRTQVEADTHSSDPIVRGTARLMSSYTGRITWRMTEASYEREPEVASAVNARPPTSTGDEP